MVSGGPERLPFRREHDIDLARCAHPHADPGTLSDLLREPPHLRRREPVRLGHLERCKRQAPDDVPHEIRSCTTELVQRLPWIADHRGRNACLRGELDDLQVEPVAVEHLVDDQGLRGCPEELFHGGAQRTVLDDRLKELSHLIVGAHALRQHRLVRRLLAVPVANVRNAAGFRYDLPPIEPNHPPVVAGAKQPAPPVTPPGVVHNELRMPTRPRDRTGAQQVAHDGAVQVVERPHPMRPPQRV